MSRLLEENEIASALLGIPGWQLQENAIASDFVFGNFKEALAFIVQVGILAEQANHHPEFTNCYNRVGLVLNTHEMNGITEKDIALARQINAILKPTSA
ncbi:MAG TPA: 4a-hydroxytetrahydrobiopterin dehydratase [Chitinophagaceae bacterium]|nr:4a-hydroxytetrahydrobiopterin dehydratase [Chitinophagaceae bacterium]